MVDGSGGRGRLKYKSTIQLQDVCSIAALKQQHCLQTCNTCCQVGKLQCRIGMIYKLRDCEVGGEIEGISPRFMVAAVKA